MKVDEYRGLRAIAKRMGVSSPTTILRLQERDGFLMLPWRRKTGWAYVTNENLIWVWQLRRAEQSAEEAKRRAKTAKKNGGQWKGR